MSSRVVLYGQAEGLNDAVSTACRNPSNVLFIAPISSEQVMYTCSLCISAPTFVDTRLLPDSSSVSACLRFLSHMGFGTPLRLAYFLQIGLHGTDRRWIDTLDESHPPIELVTPTMITTSRRGIGCFAKGTVNKKIRKPHTAIPS